MWHTGSAVVETERYLNAQNELSTLSVTRPRGLFVELYVPSIRV